MTGLNVRSHPATTNANPYVPSRTIACQGTEFLGYGFARDRQTGIPYALKAHASALLAPRTNFPHDLYFEVLGLAPLPPVGSLLDIVGGVVPRWEAKPPFYAVFDVVDALGNGGPDPATTLPQASSSAALTTLERLMGRQGYSGYPVWVDGDVVDIAQAQQLLQTNPDRFKDNRLY